MLTTVVEIQSKNAMHLSVQTSVSILVSLRSARSAAKEAHITSQNATQCAIPLPCLAPWFKVREEFFTIDCGAQNLGQILRKFLIRILLVVIQSVKVSSGRSTKEGRHDFQLFVGIPGIGSGTNLKLTEPWRDVAGVEFLWYDRRGHYVQQISSAQLCPLSPMSRVLEPATLWLIFWRESSRHVIILVYRDWFILL